MNGPGGVFPLCLSCATAPRVRRVAETAFIVARTRPRQQPSVGDLSSSKLSHVRINIASGSSSNYVRLRNCLRWADDFADTVTV